MQEKIVSYAVLGLFVISVVALLRTTDFGHSIIGITGNSVDTGSQSGSGSDSTNEIKVIEEKYKSLIAQAKELKQKVLDAQQGKNRKAYVNAKKQLDIIEKELLATKKAYEKAKQKQTVNTTVVPSDQFTNQCTEGGDHGCVFVFNKDGNAETWQIPFLHNGVFYLANGYLKVLVLKPAPNSCEVAICQKEDCSDAYTGGQPGVGELKKQKLNLGSSLAIADGSLSLKNIKQCIYGSHTCTDGTVFKWGDQGYSNHVCPSFNPVVACLQKKSCSDPSEDILKLGTDVVSQLITQDHLCYASCGVELNCHVKIMDACFKEYQQHAQKITEQEYKACTKKAAAQCPVSTDLVNDPTVFKGSKGYCKDADGPIDESKYPTPTVMGDYNNYKQWYGYFNPYVNNPVYEFDFKTGLWVQNIEKCVDEDTVSERWCVKSSGMSTYDAINCPEGMMCNNGACIFKQQLPVPAPTKEDSCTTTYECKLVNPEGYSFIKLSASNPKGEMTWMGGYNSMDFEFVSATQKSCVIRYKYCKNPLNQPSTCDAWAQATVKPGASLPKSVKLTFITESGKVCEQPKTDKGTTSQGEQLVDDYKFSDLKEPVNGFCPSFTVPACMFKSDAYGLFFVEEGELYKRVDPEGDVNYEFKVVVDDIKNLGQVNKEVCQVKLSLLTEYNKEKVYEDVISEDMMQSGPTFLKHLVYLTPSQYKKEPHVVKKADVELEGITCKPAKPNVCKAVLYGCSDDQVSVKLEQDIVNGECKTVNTKQVKKCTNGCNADGTCL
ncbi:hypothetical protein HYY69_02080 [Candidatus Woesearchaeota archaeon]|nr:hypothetical protein [Candidatus Woesearchaeota archaeon]